MIAGNDAPQGPSLGVNLNTSLRLTHNVIEGGIEKIFLMEEANRIIWEDTNIPPAPSLSVGDHIPGTDFPDIGSGDPDWIGNAPLRLNGAAAE